MKKLILSLIMLLGIVSIGYSLEMPDMSVNSAFLYSFVTKTITIAPQVDMTLVTAYDGILRGNIAAAFPNSNDATQGNFIGGPTIKIDFVKLLAKSPKITIVKEFNLEAGIGVLVDVFHLNGITIADLKKIIYPSFCVGFRF